MLTAQIIRSSPIQEHKYSFFFEDDDDDEFQKDYSDPVDDGTRDELVCMLNHDEGVEASRVLLQSQSLQSSQSSISDDKTKNTVTTLWLIAYL